MPKKFIQEIANFILGAKQDVPLRVGIDGIDAAGKTFLANEIAACLIEKGHPVIRASVDRFHNPKQIRYQRGSYSPEGYYFDSFNYERLQTCLLHPLAPEGNRKYFLSAFDFKTESETNTEELTATDEDILIFEGVFLFRPELLSYWDLKIFVEIDFPTSLQRALERDLYLFGNQEEILKKYQERYIPGQTLYLETANPKAKADIVIHNNNFTNPTITFVRSFEKHGRIQDNLIMTPTDTLTTLFSHHLWANLSLFEQCADLTSEQLDATVVGTYGSIRDTLQHIVRAEQSYFSRISTGQPLRRPEGAPPPTMAEMLESLRTTGEGLIEWAGKVKADETVEVDWEGTPRGVPKTILLTQVINHATEHRSQVLAILTQLGVESPELDGWTYFDAVDKAYPPN